MISREQHIAFYDLEIQTQLDDWRVYNRKRMNLLIKDKELFIGRCWEIAEESDSIIIRFKSKETPRLNWPYFFGIVGEDAIGSPNDWTFTFQEFIYSPDKNYYTRQGSDGEVINFYKSESEYIYFEVSFEDTSFFDLLKTNYLSQGKQPLVVVSKMYPTINYLTNLKDFVSNSESELLNFSSDEKSWTPIEIDNDSVDVNYFIDLINSNEILLVQGPPGTGKSYQAAAICDYFIKQNKSVAVCALTNKALIEIASQPGLISALNEGLVFKTNLRKDEEKLNPRIKSLNNFLPLQGNLLLTTYYCLSDFHKEILKETKRFDLLIIEEASQAFLATFAMFKELANHVMIIGDQKQLPPILTAKKEILLKINPKIDKVQLGFEAIIDKLNAKATYRLTKTRRLTFDSSDLTGLFYNNSLLSSSPLNGKIVHSLGLTSLFHPNGSVTIASLGIVGENHLNQTEIFERINKILKEIQTKDSEIKVAILVPTVYLEKLITQNVADKGLLNSKITISTIHRIQGITTDYTIYYMPLTDASIELEPKLFNVATSRAKRGTLIITKGTLLMNKMNENVHLFLSRCNDVTSSFIKLNSK
jgi:hypothetical protein